MLGKLYQAWAKRNEQVLFPLVGLAPVKFSTRGVGPQLVLRLILLMLSLARRLTSH